MSTDDEYARKYMGGDRVRFLDKLSVPKWMSALMFGSSIAGVVAFALAGAPFWIIPLAAAPAVLGWIMLSTLRTAVTDEHVQIQYGVHGPTIPLEQIVSIEAKEYDFWRFGGWGIKRGRGGTWAYSVPAQGGRCVEIKWRDGDKERTTVVSSAQAEALKAAIDDAVAARTARVLGIEGARTLDEARADSGLAQQAEAAHVHEQVFEVKS